MKTFPISLTILLMMTNTQINAQMPDKDVFQTSEGQLEIYFVGHGSLYFVFNEIVIHVDPYSRVADYSKLPQADLILITHEHRDHLDASALKLVRKPSTEILLTEIAFQTLGEGKIIRNGESRSIVGLKIDAVPAYNIRNLRENGEPFHPRGAGNGYVISFGDTKLYIAGDTEDIPEMNQLKDISIAFIPMNLPFTMSPEMAANAAKMIKPAVLYPYHFGNTDTGELIRLFSDFQNMEIRIRKF